MQLMIQISYDRLNSSLLAAAQEADISFHVDKPSVLETVTIKLTSYEWNACEFLSVS